MLNFFFSKSKQANPLDLPPDDLPTAINKNREAIDSLEQRDLAIQAKIQKQKDEAKAKVLEGDKAGALLILKRKKLYESELEKIQNSRFTLERQVLSLEAAETHQLAVSALSSCVSAQKNLNKSMDIESIDELMEELHRQADQQSELASALALPYEDEDALNAELDLLEAKIHNVDTSSKSHLNKINKPSSYCLRER